MTVNQREDPNLFYNILQGDCLEILPTLSAKSIDCIIADLPYNIKADKWDNINNYADWLKTVFEELRNYQQMAEYILFYTLQDETGLSKVMGSCVYPVREYIRSEILRAKGKIALGEINKDLGTATNGGGVASATLSLDKTCPAMITKEHYEKLRMWLNEGKEYEFLRKEYEDLRKEYEDLRYTFNNQKTHHSVWNYDISTVQGHATPKPIELIKNILRHSTNIGSVVLDPTAGSGTTIKACKDMQRSCVAIELSSKYVKKIKSQVINQTSLTHFKNSDLSQNDLLEAFVR